MSTLGQVQLLVNILWRVSDAHKEIRTNNWFLSEDYQRFIQEDNLEWNPDSDYYVRLVGRLVDSILYL